MHPTLTEAEPETVPVPTPETEPVAVPVAVVETDIVLQGVGYLGAEVRARALEERCSKGSPSIMTFLDCLVFWQFYIRPV